jgi:hypothetical protein
MWWEKKFNTENTEEREEEFVTTNELVLTTDGHGWTRIWWEKKFNTEDTEKSAGAFGNTYQPVQGLEFPRVGSRKTVFFQGLELGGPG